MRAKIDLAKDAVIFCYIYAIKCWRGPGLGALHMANQNGNGRTRGGVDKKHPFVRLKRKARLTYLRILRIDDPPERIARGAAIGRMS